MASLQTTNGNDDCGACSPLGVRLMAHNPCPAPALDWEHNVKVHFSDERAPWVLQMH